MAGENKKILIIVYYWPPSGGSGVQRWMYFAKYLPDFGYEPVILTVSPEKASYKDWDESNCDKVKEIRAYKTNTFELLKLYSFFTSGSATKGIPQGHVGSKKHGFFGKISSFIRGNLFIPDARVGWKIYALRTARKVIKKENIDLVITSGPPHSTHLIGKSLKKLTGVKWMADFRDPWSELYYNKELLRMGWAKQHDKNLEYQVLDQADHVLTIGPSLKNLLASKTPGQSAKFHYIFNGYDSEAMNSVEATRDDLFKITFIGQFALAQPHEGLIRALEMFCKEFTKEAHLIKICLAGTFDEEILKKFKQLPGAEVVFYGRVPHLDSLRLMKNSQLLLNSLAEVEESKILISGKLMEYISTGNPVLCIGNLEGDAALLLKSLPNSKMFTKTDIEGMQQFMKINFEKWRSGDINTHSSKEYLQNSRYETTRQLAALLNKIQNHV
jgi:glycosyltransferase involved in cell wall biosynthesis